MHENHRKRLRERFLKSGFENMAEHEVLELILCYAIPRVDTNPIAHRLIDRFGSFAGVCDADINELVKVEGVGEIAATFLKMQPQIFDCYYRSRYREKPHIQNSTDAGEYAVAMVGNRVNEVFALICLNAQRKVIGFEVIERGTVDETQVSPRKVAEAALRYNSASVILVHNHPSGVLHPSDNDIELTKSLCTMLEQMSVDVIDHIIVAGRNFTSFADRNMMPY